MRVFLCVLLVLVLAVAAGADTVTIKDTTALGNGTAVIDSPLRGDWPDANIGQNGTDRQWRIFSDTAAVQRHNLMKFSLSDIPAGATITSATMAIYIRRYGGTVADITGYQISRLKAGKSWLEGTNDYANPAFTGDSTWNSQAHGSIDWAAPGATGFGDIDQATSISWDLPGGSADIGYKFFDLTMFVQAWANGSWENNGILFWGGSGGDNDKYNWAYLSEAGDQTRRPYMTVEYTMPVPEPSSLMALATLSAAGLGLIRRRRS